MLKTCFEKTCFKNQTCFEIRSFEKTCILREQIHGQSILKSNTHALALQCEFHEKREKWNIEKVQCPGFEQETMWLTARRATDWAIWDFMCYEPKNTWNELPRSRVIIRIWTSTRPENTHPCTCEHGTRWPTGVRPLGGHKGEDCCRRKLELNTYNRWWQIWNSKDDTNVGLLKPIECRRKTQTTNQRKQIERA